ncbi:MAG TPA: Gfo/Idh/MocA family oxidoreductase [Bryobacteraceae bacterium]|nr:Gfo/Idh/MocA family oxidoreductase [Bryobacteraceae bacterium]
MSDFRFSRRYFFYGALLSGAVPAGGFGSVPSLARLGYRSPNEKLNLAAIGAGSQPYIDLRYAWALGRENVVALADCDWERGQQGFKAFPKAARYKDFRQMLDKSGKDIDAVVVGPPDHMHAVCALACMQLGKHVYLEKPLTRTAWEARILTQAQEKYKVATQMGNQGYSHDATRVACEIIWSGEIGEVREVHAWTRTAAWPQGMTKIPAPTPVPETLDWNLWLGCAEYRPYTAGDKEYEEFVAARNARLGRRPAPAAGAGRSLSREDPLIQLAPQGGGFYMPWNWRGFYDFGTGLIGDWGIHILGPANWALQLHPKYLISVQCVKKDSLPPFTFPDELVIRYDFAARPNMPPVSVYWYHHGGPDDPYMPPGMTAEQARKIPGTGPQVGPQQGQGGFFIGSGGGVAAAPGSGQGAPQSGTRSAPAGPMARGSGYNCIFVGTKGYLGTSGRGEGVGLLPGSRWAEYQLPKPYLTRSPGASFGSNHEAHIRDWIRACKGGAEACSNFSISGPYAEWMILGAAAVHAEGKLLWDYEKCEFTNNKEVNKWVKPTFRKGWELKL